MKVLLILVIFSAIVSSVYCWRFFDTRRLRDGIKKVQSEEKNYTRWLTQHLDPFDVTNKNTWQQRYFVSDEYFDNSKRDVAFLMIGGEEEIYEDWMTGGEWIEIGKKHKPILFQLEHRYYGKSIPTKDFTVESLKYLNSTYALADLAVFVAAMNKEYKLSPNVKWIAFGGSYAGSLAAWSRLKYPKLIRGAVASSAPLKSVVDFKQYYEVIANDLRDISNECYAAVQKGYDQVDALIADKSGQKTLTKLFQLCDPLEDSADNKNISNLYNYLAANFADIAQYNKDNRLSVKDTKRGHITLGTICDIMTNSSLGDEVTRLGKFNGLILDAYDGGCLDFKYDSVIEWFKNTSLDAGAAQGSRQWVFQTCNEFGYFQTTDTHPKIFGSKCPTKFFIQQCMEMYGPQFNETYIGNAADRVNTLYGGLNIKVDNVVFVHGSVDPWHAVGLTMTINKGNPVIYINGTSHCADFYTPRDSDPPQLKAARVQIGQYIQTWLQS